MVIAWRAKSKTKLVVMIRSSYSAGMTEVRNRRGEEVKKPVAVNEYNHSMNRVDRNDQHCIYYTYVRKTQVVAETILLSP